MSGPPLPTRIVRRLTARHLAVPLLVLLVVTAGCSGGGGDGGDATTDTTAAMETTTVDPGDAGTATTAADGADGGDGSDGGDSGDGGDGSVGVDPSAHGAALRDAGSYTLEYSITGISGQSGTFTGVQLVNLDTGERYSRFETTSGGQTFTAEYYQASADAPAYQRVSGQVSEVPADRAFFIQYADVDSGIGASEYDGFEAVGSTQTEMGPATRYVIDSVAALPNSESDAYDGVDELQFEVVVDDDTGLLLSYVYQVSYVEADQRQDIRLDMEMRDVGSTTVERPDWVPTN